MSRLFLLNLVLLGAVVAAAVELKNRYEETERRVELVKNTPLQYLPPGTYPSLPKTEKLVPANYFDIASRLLFSRDRNPNVIVTPPPEKVMPPLPVAYGVLLISNPPILFLSSQRGQPQKGYRPGDRIGEFTIRAFNSKQVDFEWDGKRVSRLLEELRDKEPANVVSQNTNNAGPPPSAQPVSTSDVLGGAASSVTAEKGPAPGEGELRGCVAGDTTPVGTVVDGYKKVVTETPFGKACRWEKVR